MKTARTSPSGLLVIASATALCALTLLHSQELPAQLQPLAEKHKSDLIALDTQRGVALERAQQTYVVALSAAESAAINASQLSVVAAIAKERGEVTKGSMSVEVPQDLPKTLQPARKAYMDTVARIAVEASTRQEKIDLEYVRSLNNLQASANAALSKEIADEKLRFLSETRVHGPVIAPETSSKPPLSSGFTGFEKPLKDQVEVVPYAWEMPTVKFKPHDKAVPDELRVAVTGQQIQISGVKKNDMSRVNGNLIAHYGKLVLTSAEAPQSGTLLAKAPYVEDGVHYGIALELTSGKITPNLIRLGQDTNYNWSIRIDGAAFIFEVTKDGQKVDSLQATKTDVKAFGFFTTARYPGNKADLTVTLNPQPKAK